MPLSRRQFLTRSFAACLTGGLAVSGYTWQIEPYWVEWVHRPLPIRNLPADLEGETLIQISDLHIGPRVDHDFLRKSLAKIQTLNPGFVVYTGDFVTYRGPQQFDELDSVMADAPHGRLGTAAILGNHDYGYGWQQPAVAGEIITRLDHHQIPVLINQPVNLNGLIIYGVDDFWGPNFSLTEAMRFYQEDQAALVLCHNPDAVDLDGWNNYRGWILSGHTHGGQCRPPFLPPPILPVDNPKYSAGHIPLTDGRDLYINRGLGFMLQIRFNVRPEITIFHLEKEE